MRLRSHLILTILALGLAACASADVPQDDAGLASPDTSNTGDVADHDGDDTTTVEDTQPDVTPEDVDQDPAPGLALADGVYKMDSLTLLSPRDPAVILNALVGPNIEDGSLIFLFRLYDFDTSTAPSGFKLHLDEGREVADGVFSFAAEAARSPAPAEIDATGEFGTLASAERATFPVVAGAGDEAMILVHLPVQSVGVTGRLTAEGTITGGSFAGVISQVDAEGIDVPVGGNTLKLSTVLGARDVDLDRDGTLDGWTVVASFTARRVQGQF